MPRDADPRSFLPLTPLASQVLLALAEGPRHGYGIILEVGERTDGLITLRTGTLYMLLQRLVEEGLIEETSKFELPSSTLIDKRRRYYELTPLGHKVLAAEVRRLESVVTEARRTRVLGRAR
jgi:DNA-binding PadR family transcriptional regulator